MCGLLDFWNLGFFEVLEFGIFSEFFNLGFFNFGFLHFGFWIVGFWIFRPVDIWTPGTVFPCNVGAGVG